MRARRAIRLVGECSRREKLSIARTAVSCADRDFLDGSAARSPQREVLRERAVRRASDAVVADLVRDLHRRRVRVELHLAAGELADQTGAAERHRTQRFACVDVDMTAVDPELERWIGRHIETECLGANLHAVGVVLIEDAASEAERHSRKNGLPENFTDLTELHRTSA
jgi:hypothetical protein